MNYKTTFVLAALLVFSILGYLVIQRSPALEKDDSVTPLGLPTAVAARNLIADPLGEIIKVSVQKKGEPAWVFEKTAAAEGPSAQWKIVEPLQANVTAWEVDRFGRDLGGLQYDISYGSSDSGHPSLAEAGLDPPEAVVTLIDKEGKSATVEMGKPKSRSETYVRLAGADEICVAKQDLGNLIKAQAIEYRDMQVWNFAPEKATRVEITDRKAEDGPVEYALSKDGAKWVMESPVTARATDKVDEMLRGFSRLRMTKWEEDAAGQLALYGLQTPALTIRVTVEEQVPIAPNEEEDQPEDSADEGEDGEPETPKTETKTTVHVLHVSDQSPIGEDTKTYVRVGDESAVASILKATTDKFKPVLSEWRDMRLTTADVDRATRIELSVGGERLTLAKSGSNWELLGEGAPAEESEVSKLLTAIKELKAIVFVEASPQDIAEFGLDHPRAMVQLTVPGLEQTERIAIGDYSDPTTQRMVFARRNDVTSVGKVRSSDVEAILREPNAYRNRTVFDLSADRIEKFTLLRQNPFSHAAETLSFERRDGAWRMTEPVNAEVQSEPLTSLVETVAGLHAEAVVAAEAEASAFGLHAPQFTATLIYKPPVEYRIPEPSADPASDEEAEETNADEGKSDEPVEYQPPPQTYQLIAAQHDGALYAKRVDRSAIYRLPPDTAEQLKAEFRSEKVLAFDAKEVRRFSIRHGDRVDAFVRDNDRWVYEAEPDLPLDKPKVENLLLQFADLKTRRYVTQSNPEDWDFYGLSSPSRRVEVSLENGTSIWLNISDRKSSDANHAGQFSSNSQQEGAYLLTSDEVARIDFTLDELEPE